MVFRRTLPIDFHAAAWRRVLRVLVPVLVLSSLTTHGVGISLLKATAARAESEESGEESKSEVELRELSHRCARVRFAGPRKDAVAQTGPTRNEAASRVPVRPGLLTAAHLVGAGICLRC